MARRMATLANEMDETSSVRAASRCAAGRCSSCQARRAHRRSLSAPTRASRDEGYSFFFTRSTSAVIAAEARPTSASGMVLSAIVRMK